MSAALLFTFAFALALAAGLVVKLWLATRQVRHVARHRDAVPAAFAQAIALAAHQKAADYTVAKTRFGLLEMAWGTALLLGWTLLGGLDLLNKLLMDWMGGGMLQQLALLSAFALISGLLDLPFTLWQTFRLEERFGFNKMTWRLWLLDGAKSLLLGALIGLPIAALMLWLMGAAGNLWWLWAWGAWMAFNLLLMLVYPTFIAPLFNKFQPLDDATLKARVNALMKRCGFAAKGLFVMDGSKRSAHANAYFTGFGASKRVVFYDTLLRQLSAGEVEAVLAHELGHFKHRHVVKRMAAMFALSLAGFGRCWAGCRSIRGSMSASAYSPTWQRPTMHSPSCSSCSRCRSSASSSRRCRCAFPASTSSRPTPMRSRKPAAPTSRRRCSSSTRTTPRR